MEYIFYNIVVIFQNALTVIWYWMNTYVWELLLFICLCIIVGFEINESRVHYVDDNRKVV